MTTRKRLPPAKDWRNRDIADWNVHTFVAYLSDRTRERFGVEYVPLGAGSTRQRWARECGMLKAKIDAYGPEVVRAWLDRQMDAYRPTPNYPYPTIAFMITYRDGDLPVVQAELANADRERKAVDAELSAEELKDVW